MPLIRLANRSGIKFRRWRAVRISLDEARSRVAEGAAIMDVLSPGWYARIDEEKLDLCDARCCILGQLYGSFQAGLLRNPVLAPDKSTRSAISPVSLGLIGYQDVEDVLHEQDCEYLVQAWLIEIEARRSERWRRRNRIGGQRGESVTDPHR